MESLLMNYLEESKTGYVDVEIIEYSINDNDTSCDVKFTHTEPIMFESVEENCTIGIWKMMAFVNMCNYK